MRKLLLLAVILLSGCVCDTTVYEHYSVNSPEEKASLFVEKPNYYDNEWEWNQKISSSSAFQEAYRKYFVKSDKHHADFILRQTGVKDETGDAVSAWAFFSGFTLGIIPMWGEGKASLSYSLTDTKNQKTIRLSDIRVKGRFFFGWLMMPAVLFPGVRFLDDDTAGNAFAVAIEEAASRIYDPNNRLYPKEKKVPDTPATEKNAEQPQGKVPSAPSTNVTPKTIPEAPVKEPSSEEMDLLW